jgi:hypothetical protein
MTDLGILLERFLRRGFGEHTTLNIILDISASKLGDSVTDYSPPCRSLPQSATRGKEF